MEEKRWGVRRNRCKEGGVGAGAVPGPAGMYRKEKEVVWWVEIERMGFEGRKGGLRRKVQRIFGEKRGRKGDGLECVDSGDLEAEMEMEMEKRRETWASFSTGSSVVELVCS